MIRGTPPHKKEYYMFREETAAIEGLAERIAKLRGSL